MITENTFSKEDKLAIAEYIFSYHSDVLIKSDAYNLINLFEKYKIEPQRIRDMRIRVAQGEAISDYLYRTIEENISKEILEDIMDEYQSGKL